MPLLHQTEPQRGCCTEKATAAAEVQKVVLLLTFAAAMIANQLSRPHTHVCTYLHHKVCMQDIVNPTHSIYVMVNATPTPPNATVPQRATSAATHVPLHDLAASSGIATAVARTITNNPSTHHIYVQHYLTSRTCNPSQLLLFVSLLLLLLLLLLTSPGAMLAGCCCCCCCAAPKAAAASLLTDTAPALPTLRPAAAAAAALPAAASSVAGLAPLLLLLPLKAALLLPSPLTLLLLVLLPSLLLLLRLLLVRATAA
jgi:hypothetical protein